MRWRLLIVPVSTIAIIVIAIAVMYTRPSVSDKRLEFTAFIAEPGTELGENNRICEKIAQKTGCIIKTEYLNGGSLGERLDRMIVKDKYPDFIDAYEEMSKMIEVGALVPLEGYIDEFPNIKSYLTQEQWDELRNENGHIYLIPQYNIINKEDTETQYHSGAFWMQKCVLEWAGYPKICVLKDYFAIINAYLKEHKTFQNQATIGFLLLCQSGRDFGLTNPPHLLAGYPNDGCAMVDEETLTAKLYDFIPEAKEYYRILNQEYLRGTIYSDTFVTSYEEYLDIIASGRVLGLADQYWQFEDAQNALYARGLVSQTYVPLYLTMAEEIEPQYIVKKIMDPSHGIGISKSCKDVREALQFINDLLDPELMKLRYWGEEGIDYEVSETGVFYRTIEQRDHARDQEYMYNNFCNYNYLPHYEGYLEDNINVVLPLDQPGEYFASLCEYDQRFLEAHNCRTFMDPTYIKKEHGKHVWSKLSTYTMNLNPNSRLGKIRDQLQQIRNYWLPQVIMSEEDSFEEVWQQYYDVYHSEVDIETYENAMTEEVRRRVKRRK